MVMLRRPGAGATPAGGALGVRGMPAAGGAPGVRLDPQQGAAVSHRGGRGVVLGAPGTGKTTVAVSALVARAREAGSVTACVLLAPSRVAAGELRLRVTTELGMTSTEPLARTPSSLAFGILRRRAALAGLPPPRLLSGPEQDVVLRELLAGHQAGVGAQPGWPDALRHAVGTRGFRAELRDLLMRAAERGVTPADLAHLGRAHDRPEWVSAATVAAEYHEVTALARPGGLDPSALLGAAAEALEDDPGLLAASLPGLSLVVVDDAQELTPPGGRLLAALTAGGADLLLIGDPDAATQTFRGGDPRLFLSLGAGAPTYLLGTRWRQPPALAEVTDRVAARIGSVGAVAHRRPDRPNETEDRPGQAAQPRVLVARTAAQEAQHVADVLRRAHLLDGRAWSAMAVIVRGAGRTATLRRVLAAAGVPVSVPGAQTPLRDEPVVRSLLALFGVCLRVASGQAEPLAREEAVDLLASPICGMDAVAIRRLRRALRRQEAERDGVRGADDLLVAGLLGDACLTEVGGVGGPARRLARALAAGVEAAIRRDHLGGGAEAGEDAEADGSGSGEHTNRLEPRWAPGVTAETVLWAVWSAAGLADPWRRTALAGGPAGLRADRDLDAVVALFDVAATYVDRLPGRGPDGFLDHVQGQDVAGDTLVARAPADDCVTLTTPQGAAGREWDLVVVAGLQEGVWPDLRLRGSVLGSQDLVDVLDGRAAGPREALAAVRYDETRLFHVAVSRARDELLVTAVSNEDEQASPFLDLVDGGGWAQPSGAGAAAEEERPIAPSPVPMSLPGAVARLRRAVVLEPSEAGRRAAARRLVLLTDSGVPGADPLRWWALVDPSDDRPRRAPGEVVRVSPSKLGAFNQCQLRWLYSGSGGDRPRPGGADAVGTLVHAIAADVDNTDLPAMQTELDRRWPALGMAPGWLSERSRLLARDMVARLARYHEQALAEGWQVVGREVSGRAIIGDAEIRGQVDRLERGPDGRLRVIDLKTGSTKAKPAELPTLPQLAAYQVLVEEGAFEEVGSASAGAALLQIGKNAIKKGIDLQVQPPLSDSADPTWARRLVTESATEMAAAAFTARVGDWCRTCPGRVSCPLSGDGDVI